METGESDVETFWGIEEALSSKASPLSIGSWTTMASAVDGRDHFFKMIQFAARGLKWTSLQQGDASASAAWNGLYLSVQEGRKSTRWLKGLNKINQLFDEVPNADSTIRKFLLVCQHLGLGLHWHFDYLAHLHRQKFLKYDEEKYARIFRMPGFVWSVSNVAQVLLGLMNLHRASQCIRTIRAQLHSLVAGGTRSSCAGDIAEQKHALEAQLKTLAIMRFQGWLLVVKGIADLMTSCAMNGPRLQRRFPKTFGWMHDGTVGVAGFVSGLIVVFNYFPSKAKLAQLGWKDGKQTLQRERNLATWVFALMQCQSILGGYQPAIPQAAA